jgi:hypothetical protein
VYLVIVFLSVILPMLLLSSKLKRNLIIAQNLTEGTGMKELALQLQLCYNELDKELRIYLPVVILF